MSPFPDTLNKKIISVSPNKGPNTVFGGNRPNEGGNKGQNTSRKMTSVIIGEAPHIISKRSECDLNNMKENFDQIQEALKENESNLSKIENKMEELFENLQKKLDGMERKLEQGKIQSKNKGSQEMKLNATTSH